MQINSIGAVQVFDLHNAVAVVRLIGDGRSLDGESCKIDHGEIFHEEVFQAHPALIKVSLTSARPPVVTSKSEPTPLRRICVREFLDAAFRGVKFLQEIVERKCAA